MYLELDTTICRYSLELHIEGDNIAIVLDDLVKLRHSVGIKKTCCFSHHGSIVQPFFNPFTGEFMVTVSDINGLFFLFFLNKIYSKTGI